jgi:hypothetical protein
METRNRPSKQPSDFVFSIAAPSVDSGWSKVDQ